MKIQKYVNRLTSKFKISKYYKEWLLRTTRIQAAYKDGQIQDDELEKFQLFLLQTGQFNANFRLEELVRLKYPRSPFAMMHMNDYLRCVDSWVMEVLRALYQEEHTSALSHPLWVDSPLVWRELQRYCRVKSIFNYTINQENAGEIYDEIEKNNKNFRLWLFIKKQENQTVAEHEKSLKQNVLKELANNISFIFIEKLIANSILLKFFKQSQANANQYNFTPEETNELLIALNEFFPDIFENNITTHNARIARIDAAILEENHSKKTLLALFNQFRKELLTEGISILDGLEELARNKENFENMLHRVKNQITIETSTISSYSVATKNWINQKITPQTQAILNRIIFCSDHQYEKMDALVIYNPERTVTQEEQGFNKYNWEGSLNHVERMLDNLGYRIDPVRVLRILLKKFPLLFIDIEQTNMLWTKLINTSMVQGLDLDEKNQIARVGKAVAAAIATSANIHIKISENFIFDKYSSLLSDMGAENAQEYIHAEYIKTFLMSYKEFSNRYPYNFSIMRSIVEKEIKTALYHFIYSQDIAIKTRYTQTISEIMNFYFENINLSNESLLPTLVANQITPHLSAQSGMITVATSYAMRAFVRVFQLLESQQQCSKIYVTNQAYYELLINLGNMNLSNTDISMVQTFVEINDDADILFIELHPNNIAASYQFKHDIAHLLHSMTTWNQRKRTLVIDITLNMINDGEIINILTQLDELVSQGWLNIILIQSLTKFMQLGLDQRSGGMLVVISNHKKWNFIAKINEINQYELVDVSTMKFFSFFMWGPKVLLKYIEDIKNNCRYVYQKTVENINDFETPEANLCQLLVSSDDGSCYLGLNINGLLARVDHTLSLDVKTAEDFLSDILKYFLIPICEELNLPLTERESIGFPLSSINIAFASFRITIGLEHEAQLNSYAWIIAYLVFILNSKNCIAQCFGLYDTKKINFLSQHADQFIAAYKNEQYSFYTKLNGRKFHVSINGIDIRLSRIIGENSEIPVVVENTTIFLGEYQRFKLIIIQNNEEPIGIANLSNMTHELMIISYLSYPDMYPGDYCTIDEESRKVILSSRFILKEKYSYLYGPYPSNNTREFNSVCLCLGANGRDRILYCFPDKKPCIWLNPTGMKMFFGDMFSLVKKGNILTAIYDMPFSELEFLMQEGAYTTNNKPLDHPYIKADNFQRATFGCNRQYIPNGNMQIHCTNINRFPHREIMIEHDFICHKAHGVTTYKRNLGATLTAIEIDYWMIKDPIARRFLSLMIALYSKEFHKINFISRDHCFNHFLFDLSYESANQVFSTSMQIVIQFQSELISLLDDYCHKPNNLLGQGAVFFKPVEHQMQWPSGSNGVDSINNKPLIIAGLKILGVSSST